MQQLRFFEKIAPARRMDRLRSALFLIHGKNDPRVPFSEALQIVKSARDAGGPVWTLYADNEGHGFSRRENRDYTQAATAVFLRRFLIVHHRRADQLFKLGRFREAIGEYDKAIADGVPHSEDSCWERGLAYYYTGDFDAGRRQFEGYHKVGPLDIENGIWRYLCTAEKEGLEEALKTFYPYPRKARPPFPALHALYSGKGSIEDVLAQATSTARSAEESRRNLFYGHYYVGKYLEVTGKPEEARKHIEKALRHRESHFMYDCARIDLERLKKPR